MKKHFIIFVVMAVILLSLGQVTFGKTYGGKSNGNVDVKPSGTATMVSSGACESISKRIDDLALRMNDQSRAIDHLLKEIQKKQPNPLKEYAVAIIQSIIAAVIFWIAFSLLPEKRRLKKLRPKLEFDIYEIYRSIFFIFDCIMRFNSHSPSTFQKLIKGGKLGIEEIELGLQNKCMNESYLYDEKINALLMPIGQELFERFEEIDKSVEKVFSFSNYLSTSEILLLEKIRKKLEVYNLKDWRCKLHAG